MKLNVETPRQLVDINGLPLDTIETNVGRRPEDRRAGDATATLRTTSVVKRSTRSSRRPS